VFHEPPGERVLDDGDGCRLPHRAGRVPAAVGPDLLHDGDQLSDLHPAPPVRVTGTGSTCQMSRAYSRTVRSLENGPMPAASRISAVAPSSVPTSTAPLRGAFMFPVPEASVPAVEMCWESSQAGKMRSALETP